MKNHFFLLLCTITLLFGCLEDAKPDPRKKYKYHVLLRDSSGNQAFYAGSTIGLASCSIVGRRALRERAKHELAGKEWGIVCCWYTDGKCLEEHHYQDKDVPYEEWNANPKYHIKPLRQVLFKG